MARKRRGKKRTLRRMLLAIAAIPLLYLVAALAGSLIPVNGDWEEPENGTTVYVANNGVHVDLILPMRAQGLDWKPLLAARHLAGADAKARWVAFGAGERRVYLDTPTWWDLSPATVWAALTGGTRVMHVEWVRDPSYATREIRLRPEEYRRLWAAIRAEFNLDTRGRPQQIDHPGYGPADAFYEGIGKATALDTCNSWVADRLRIAGVKASLWSPFAQGVTWRYREVGGKAP